MVYLAELLVVMTDRLKIARIRARYVPRVHGHMHLEDEFLASLSLSLAPGKRWCRMLMRRGAVLLKHKKIVFAHVWQWPLSKKVVATV